MSEHARAERAALALGLALVALLASSPDRARANDDIGGALQQALSAPTMRFGFGGAAYAAPEDAAGTFEFDLALGLRVFVAGRAGPAAWLTPEIGYTRHGAHSRVTGRSFFVGGSAALPIAETTALVLSSALTLGRTHGQGGVGLRTALRLEVLFGLVGLEVGHDWRDVDGADLHGVRVLITTDLFVPVQLVRFFSWLASF